VYTTHSRTVYRKDMYSLLPERRIQRPETGEPVLMNGKELAFLEVDNRASR
jgi:hypothetical protein